MELIRKALFVLRYLLARIIYRAGLQMKGFVFLEADVTFIVKPGGKITLEKGVYIKKGAILECASTGTILIKEGANIGHYAWIGSTYRVEIGPKTLIAQGASVFDATHEMSKGISFADLGYLKGVTIIGADCLIGAKATVSANVKIGRGCIVAANSVVLSDLSDYYVAGGVPAKFIRERI